MKNNIIYTLISLALIAILTSCSKDFLETPSPSPTYEINFSSEANAELAIIGCYDIMGWDGQHNTIPFFFGDIVGHDGHKGGDIGGDQDWMDHLINFTYTADNYMLNKAYTNYFKGVGRANSSIENIGKMGSDIISDEKRNQFIAEANFTRAYFYFELVKTFGSVPLVDRILKPSEYQQPLVSEDAIYSFIESTLLSAIDNLPGKNQAGIEYTGRANKEMAQALLVKTYIYQQKWTEAKNLSNVLINQGTYNLLDNYTDIFSIEHENNNEIIFSIQFTETGNGDYGDENEGSMFSCYMTTRGAPFAGIGGWGFNCPTQDFADEFEEGDIRKDATLITDGEILWEGTPDEQSFNTNFATNKDKLNNQKYALPKSFQPSDFSDASKNWIVIRYADVLLWNAEATFHTGGDWNTPLQLIRDRAGLEATSLTGIEAIYHERRVELGMEGHRFWDVVRQGRGQEVLGEYGYMEGVHNHFPIPQDQLDLSDIW